MRYITIALAKGRLAKKAMEIFEQIGIPCEEMKDEKTRKLIFTNTRLFTAALSFFPDSSITLIVESEAYSSSINATFTNEDSLAYSIYSCKEGNGDI